MAKQSDEPADGARMLFRVVRDAVRARTTASATDAERLAASVVGEMARSLSWCLSDLPRNALLASDLEDALFCVLDDAEVADHTGRERAGLVAASLMAALDEKWDFVLRPDWLRQAADDHRRSP